MAESVTVIISRVDNQRLGADFASASQFYELKIISPTVLRHQVIQFRQAQYGTGRRSYKLAELFWKGT